MIPVLKCTKDLEGFTIQAALKSHLADLMLLVSEEGDCACIAPSVGYDGEVTLGLVAETDPFVFSEKDLVSAGVYTSVEYWNMREMAKKTADNRSRLQELKELARLKEKYDAKIS